MVVNEKYYFKFCLNKIIMIKKPNNYDAIIYSFNRCDVPYAYIMAYYLSKFDEKAYQKLGFGKMGDTHEKIAQILETTARTIKNCRDAFDPYYDNPRKGYDNRELYPAERNVYEGFSSYSEEELYAIVSQILETPHLDPDSIFDLVNKKLGNEPEAEIIPDEPQKLTNIYEGSVYQVIANVYERNPIARQKCIEYYGTKCYVCHFDFGQVYGYIGQGFIHVHHLKPISENGQEHQVDPIQYLRPVCPNCHAMIHSKNPPFTIEELKNMIK